MANKKIIDFNSGSISDSSLVISGDPSTGQLSKVSYKQAKDYFIANITGSGDSIQTINAGSSSTVSNGKNIVLFNPTSSISDYSLTLPSTWHSSNDILICFGGILTSGSVIINLGITGSSGHTLLQFDTPFTANVGEIIRYHLISGSFDQRIN